MSWHPDAVQELPLIKFSVPYRAGLEAAYLADALASDHWHGDGPWTTRTHDWLVQRTGAARALLTTSCTHALELAALLLDLGPGDEVVVPSFTFSSTAAAVALRGAVPVFVDCRPETMNIDPACVEAAISERTKAIFVMHYAGVGCDMAAVQTIADRHGLPIVEDNAHGLAARWQGRTLGTFGVLATQSFHNTKNVTSGEGGALLVNDVDLTERAEVIREKGTNRSRFLRGQVDKYTWIDQGSSYLPSDVLAALLMAQLEEFDEIHRQRHAVWDRFHTDLAGWAAANGVEQMAIPDGAEHPAHMYYLMMPGHDDQTGLLGHLRDRRIVGTFHYLPLDASPAGQQLGRTPYPCPVTHDRSLRLVRLPLFAGMSEEQLDRIVTGVTSYRVGQVSYSR